MVLWTGKDVHNTGMATLAARNAEEGSDISITAVCGACNVTQLMALASEPKDKNVLSLRADYKRIPMFLSDFADLVCPTGKWTTLKENYIYDTSGPQ